MSKTQSKTLITQIGFNLSPKVGGPYASILSMHLALYSQNRDNRLIFSTSDLNTINFLKSKNLGRMQIFFKKRYLVKGISLKFAYQIIISVKSSDWIHIHGYYSLTSLYSAYICILMRKSFSIQPHGSLDKWEQRKHLKLKAFLNRTLWYPIRYKCKVVVMTSAQELEDLKTDFFPNSKVLIMGYGLPNNEIYQTQDQDILKAINSASFNVLFLGRVSLKKRLDIVNMIISNTLAKGISLHLLVAGPIESDSEEIVKDVKAQLGPNVTFVGPVYDPSLKRKLFEYSSALVLPSESENFGFVVLEAMRAGLPILTSSRVGSIEGACPVCQKVYILDNRNIKDWEDVLLQLHANRGLKSETCDRNCIPIQYHKLWDNFIDRYIMEIEKVDRK